MKKYYILFLFFSLFSFSQEESIIETTTTAEPKIIEEIPKEVAFATIEQIPLFKECNATSTIIEQKACFNAQMQRHIQLNFRYPQEASDNEIGGRVFVIFTINKEGYVSNIKVSGSQNEYRELFENEAKRIIEKLPQFTPGLQKGKPVNVVYTIPINFNP